MSLEKGRTIFDKLSHQIAHLKSLMSSLNNHPGLEVVTDPKIDNLWNLIEVAGEKTNACSALANECEVEFNKASLAARDDGPKSFHTLALEIGEKIAAAEKANPRFAPLKNAYVNFVYKRDGFAEGKTGELSIIWKDGPPSEAILGQAGNL